VARRNVFICDGAQCGAVLVRPDDGFLILGAIKTTDIDAEPKTLVDPKAQLGSNPELGATPGPETALCKMCMAKALSLPLPPE
jgi:hypothetical protein